MVLKRFAAVVISAAAGMVVLAGCGEEAPSYTDAAPDQMVASTVIVEARLSDNRFLDCTDDRTYYGRYVLDCDWSNPRNTSDPTKRSVGTFKVFQKLLTDNRVLDCISLRTYYGSSVDNCDWVHPKRLTVS